MTPSFDVAGFRAMNGLAGQWVWLDAVFIFMATYLIVVMAALLFAYVAAAWKTDHFEGRTENFWHVCVALALALAAETAIGFLYFRPRPFVALDQVVKLIGKSPFEKSFPSGHASAAFAMAFAMYMHNRKWGTVFLLLAFLVGIGRIIVGVHYPLDVMGGMIVGYLAALSAAPVKKAIEPWLELFPVFRKYKRRA